jgi:cytochrome c
MQKYIFLYFLILFQLSCTQKENKILLFTKTQGFRHSSIGSGVNAILKIGRENNLVIDTTSDASKFTEDNLKQYSSLLFLHSTGELFNAAQKNALQRYIQAGGGWVGIHAACDAEYQWPWYNKLAGAYFMSHPHPQKAKLKVLDQNHPSTKHLDKEWMRFDEWYDFKSLNQEVKVLLEIDESSYEGGKNGPKHPMTWYHEYDGGRAWYTGLGHTEESFQEEAVLKHILGGIQWSIGKNVRDYKKAKTPLRPEDNRFTVERLVKGQLFQPTEMTILPNKDVLIAQRKGELMLYSESKKKLEEVSVLDVYHTTTKKDVNVEEGLMGLQKDPDYAKNNYIYLFYAATDTAVNRLSRFVFKGDSLHKKSEMVILEVASQRDICCHTGGSIAFSGDGQYLFVSTGDNTTPFDVPDEKFVNKGYAPQDERSGYEQYDAKRSSANTNDLRGKILRLKRNSDASFSVPDDNLFKPGTPQTRPEIYVMGNRNPYRISVDQKNSYLYWGEVGPDAGANSETRGPRGYDEINQAKKPGNFGWPLFVGNNYAYNRYNYTTGKSGEKYDPEKPVNDSKNNTGLTQLPPGTSAMIYYPYDKSEEFPMLESGGRTAMAGPVYYQDLYQNKNKIPPYYNGKLLIYDWIRNWIKWVHVDSDNYIEPFLEEYDFSNIIDMEISDDGQIYILEYGKGWLTKNSDSGLSRVNYAPENRVPRVKNIKVDKEANILPHTFTATVTAMDYDQDKLTYNWYLDGKKYETSDSVFTKTINQISQSTLKCIVTDAYGNEATSETIILNSGNAAPKIEIKVKGNQTFYFDEPIEYSVTIHDDQEVIINNSLITKEMNSPWDQAGHANLVNGSIGENLISTSDCMSCHKKDTMSIGPSYLAIAKRYKNDKLAKSFLSEKIRLGGSGNWGEGAMAAHPTITEQDADLIVDWILSLVNSSKKEKSLPFKGDLLVKPDPKDKSKNMMFLKAIYTDAPTNKSKPITVNNSFKLQNTEIEANRLPMKDGFEKLTGTNKEFRKIPANGGKMLLENIDLYSITQLALYIEGKKANPDILFEIQLMEKQSHKVAGKGTINNLGKNIVNIFPSQAGSKDYLLEIKPKGGWEPDLLLEKLVFVK